jgi:malonyl-CoA O-methyltransferase
VSGAYDRWAAQYDDNHNLTRDLDAEVVRRAPLHLVGRDVLELGCGTGKNTIWLASKARELVAMDFSSGMLEAARRRIDAANTRFVRHDVRTPWPVADDSVDVVIGNLILEHVKDLTPIYAEANRVLRPSGQLFLCELHPYKQLAGSQAQFTDPDSGDTVRVHAFQHSVSEYVNTGLASGFALRDLSEWADADASPATPPRLISVLFELVN